MYQVVKSHTDQLLKKGLIKSWEHQINIPLEVNGYVICDYRIDFVVHHHDGTTEYVETKGRHFRDWVLKWKLFEALYSDKPDVKLTIVQQESLWGKTPRPPKLRKVRRF